MANLYAPVDSPDDDWSDAAAEKFQQIRDEHKARVVARIAAGDGDALDEVGTELASTLYPHLVQLVKEGLRPGTEYDDIALARCFRSLCNVGVIRRLDDDKIARQVEAYMEEETA